MKEQQTDKLDIAGLLALKAYERPDANRIQKNIQNTMQAVRAANKRPTLHFFPDKSTAWMFAQPRYGIAALFVIFLGLHLLNRPMPAESVGAAAVEQPDMEMNFAGITETNAVSPAVPAIPATRRTSYSSLIQPVSFTE